MNRMAEAQAGVPQITQKSPQRLLESAARDVRPGKNQDVHVGMREQLATSEPADRQSGDAGPEHRGEMRVRKPP